MAKRWRDDEGFVSWLTKVKYIEWETDPSPNSKEPLAKIKTFMTEGIYLYMYESYREGKSKALTQRPVDPFDLEGHPHLI